MGRYILLFTLCFSMAMIARSQSIIYDTLTYPYAKRNIDRNISLNPNTSASGVAQIYDIPEEIHISGFEFFAFVTNPSSTNPVDLECRIYTLAGNTPSGQPIAQTTVRIRSNSNTSLAANRRVASFPNPIPIQGRFALAVVNPSNEDVTIFTNNWASGDGDGEYLNSLLFTSGWLPSTSVTVGGAPFDADFYIHPFVSYPFSYGFTVSERCLTGTDTITYKSIQSPFLFNRFTNKAVFNGSTTVKDKFSYKFDNGPWVNRVDTTIIYGLPGKHVISHTTKHELWSGDRDFVFKDSIDEPPVADFQWQVDGRELQVKNNSTGIDDILWSFGDSVFSVLLNPKYNYQKSGQYEVMLVVKNGCGSDTATAQITIQITGISPQPFEVSLYPNPANNYLFVNTTTHQLQQYTIVSANGAIVAQGPLSGTGQHTIAVDVLPKGLYHLLLTDNEGHMARYALSKM